jgi:hypothetical protein
MMRLIQPRFLGHILAYSLGLFVLGFPHTAIGQVVNGTLVGTVTDASDAAVAGAQVTATVPATGISHTTTTNGSGNYTFPNMPPGVYSIKVDAPGFKAEVQENINLLVDTTPRADFKLQPGAVNQTVVVNTAPAVLQTDTADVDTNIEQAAVQDMPLVEGRNFEGLLNLVPGATPAISERSAFFNAANTLQTEVNGISQNFNLYQIEGVDDEEASGDLQIEIPPAEAIQNVSVTTNDYDAALGTAAGAVTNVTLKSGTDQFHGSVFWFIQNNAVNARSYFSGPLGHMSYNYVGGTVGGPIVKGKLFFFFDYLRTMDDEATANTLSIPDSRWYTNAGLTQGCTDPTGCVDLSGALAKSGASTVGQIYDPSTGDGTTAHPRKPFANNQIPYSRINPITLKMLTLLDASAAKLGTFKPNVPLSAPVNNYTDNLPFNKDSNSYDVKFDYTPNQSNHLTYRYSYQSFNIFQAATFGPYLGGPAAGAFQGTGLQPTFNTGGSYDHIFSPKFFTQLRLGVAHLHNTANVSDYGTNDAETLGIPGVNIASNPFTSGQIGVALAGDFNNSTPANGAVPIIGYSTSQSWERADLAINAANNWTRIVGNHTITWGGEIYRLHNDLIQPSGGGRGQYNFSDVQTSTSGAKDNDANDMASWLLDQPSELQRGVASIEPTIRNWYFALFANDKFQVTPKISFTYGLRWEDYRAPTPNRPGGFSSYYPADNTLRVAGIGSNPLNMGLVNNFHYFAPRTGITYRLNDSTVVRGGFGISYVPFKTLPIFTNYPITTAVTYLPTGTSSFTPAVLNDGVTVATFQQGFPAQASPTVPSSGIIPVTSALISNAFTVLNTHSRAPMAYSYNLAVERSFGSDYSLDVAYVGNHASRITIPYNLNHPTYYGGGTASLPEFITIGRSSSTAYDWIGVTSNYNAFQAKFTKRFTHGLSLFSAFTWAKALAYGGGEEISQGYYFYLNIRRNYAPVSFNQRRNYEQTFTYELPVGRGHKYFNSTVGDVFLGGWKLSAMFSVVSGLPFTATASASTLNTPNETQTATLTGKLQHPHGIGVGHNWFNPAQFSQPSGCTTTPCTNPGLGNTGINEFTGPAFFQNNFSLVKTFATYREISTQLRIDAFQLTNTPQFGLPNSTITSSTFGQISTTVGSGEGSANGIGGGRALEAGLKIMF